MTVAAEIPDTKIGIAPVMPNHVKVQLRYLTKEAKHEAETLMLSSHNLLKPATGDPIVAPAQDIVWGRGQSMF